MIWLTADHHFEHENIIRHCNRPFENALQMERELIRRHNALVKPGDTVFFIGDLHWSTTNSRGRLPQILKKMHGDKHLILGNHDNLKPFTYVEIGITSVHTALDIGEFILVHDPAATQINNRERNFVVGHVHDMWKRCKNAVNVGVDIWSYAPVSICEVRKEMAKGAKE